MQREDTGEKRKMSRKALMSEPVCLIENDETNKLSINKEALQILTSITEPLVVVAIVGKYRTGKSYLMNNLAGSKKGFPQGSTMNGKTKGIWMWCVTHPFKHDHVLVLLDTEGLGDVKKGNSKNDAWIFCLAVLLSSNLVLNTMGTIDQQAMEQLHYVTELTKRIRLRVSGQKEDETVQYKRIFPSFTWCVRDFTLELEHNGKDITEDEYLMISLKRKQEDPNSQDPDHMKEIEDYNLPRRCILQYFHSHKCFVFGFPVIPKKLKDLENLADHDLEGEFVAQSKRFCNYIFRSGSIKTLPGALVVNGRMLGSLAVSYVEAIKSGSVPCIENAVVALAESENTQAVKDAVTKYEAEMNKHVGTFPTETEKEFVQLHLECEKTALEVFMARSFQDNEQTHQHAFKDKIKSVMEKFSQRNEESSSQFCMKLLDELNQTLQTNIAENYYSKPGGHKLFLEEKKKIMETYKTRPGRGVKAHSAEQEFLTNLKEIETTIRSADVSMSEKDKERAAENAKKEVLRREKEMAEETNKKLEERLKLKKKRVEHHKEMLEKKMEEEKEKMKKENKEFLERNLKDQEAEQEFLANFTNNENQTTIRRADADVSMSEKEKEIAAEKAEAEAAGKEKEIAEETNKKLEESLEQERKPSEQHMEMLTKMIKEEREKMVKENEAFLERKLKMILAECLAQENKRFEQFKVELEQKMQEEREKMRKEYEAILKRKLKEADDLQEAKFKKLTSKLSDHSSFSEGVYL